ncbi:alpha-1,2-fucosyltransferase [Acetatifactor muris]|uniref:alpha-1,2-fucosyltransferase n=1 Tax=Acetatifactor muris TaxID=879566 RepID=UPI0015586741|nr:alpha-1,2-fucosyltransferase [Acetatifactor muris]MCR2045718.1 alpha-1,2-fucosyltransferase [Acetatifactor muris]
MGCLNLLKRILIYKNTNKTDRKVIIKTQGGLGNQLFQYAAGLEIAKRYNYSIMFELEFQKKSKRKFELRNLGIKERILSDEQKKTFVYRFQNFLIKLYEKFIAYSFADNEVTRRIFALFGVFFCNHNNPDIPHNLFRHNTIVIAGSFSNEKYFQFVLNDLQKKVKRYLVEWPFEYRHNTVCVHIRRGDYVGNAVHEVCTDKYYYRAMDEIVKQIGECYFVIFSDDIDYIKRNMQFCYPYTVCTEKNTIKSWYYMIQCDHYIISNSTFSWWAQRLNANAGKVVIAPQKWFNTSEKCDLYHNDWIKI